MKKILLSLLICLFISGCDQNEVNINSIIEEDENVVVGINYPTTGIKSFDKEIKEYIKYIYNSNKELAIKEDIRLEINIDYTYNVLNDRYYSVLLKVFIDNLEEDYNESCFKTFVYDKDSKKIIGIDSLVDSSKLNKISELVKKELNMNNNICLKEGDISLTYDLFVFDEEYITFYFKFNNACGITEVKIPLHEIGIVSIQKGKKVIADIALPNRIIDTDKKLIALTFDDGPSVYTNRIIDYLKEENVVGTFFVLGNKVSSYSDTLKKMVLYGNEIGNHTYSHKLLSRLKEDDLKFQINQTQLEIKRSVGYTPTLFRPTYGSISSKIRKGCNLSIVLWDIDTLDWKIKSSKKIANRVLKKIDDKDIILMHDTYERTYKALKIMIPKLKEEGYVFVTVSELNEIKVLLSVPN